MNKDTNIEDDAEVLINFSEDFKNDFLKVQKYITDPCGMFEGFCKEYNLPYYDSP